MKPLPQGGGRPVLAAGAALLSAWLCLPSIAAADEPAQVVGAAAQTGLALTVYNQDLALVSDSRRVELPAGDVRLIFDAVAERLRPETVVIGGTDATLVEQGFEADVLSPRRLLERSLGETVWVRRVNPADGTERYREGVLLSIAEAPLVRLDDRLETVPLDRIVFQPLTEGLRPRPALVATLRSAAAGPQDLHLRYLTGGLSWQADYVAELNDAEDRLHLQAYVTLTNTSGTAFRDAALRLVAGDVNQVSGAPLMARMEKVEAMPMAMAAPQDLAVQPAGDQHLYSLDRTVSLDDRETKQVVLLAAGPVPVRKVYSFENLVNAFGGDEIGPVKAAVTLMFENGAAAGLGRALPAGVVRVYQPLDADGAADAADAAILIGEDRIAHTADGETVTLTTGRAFDITGRARQTVFERISDKTYDTGQAIEVRNAKDRPVTVEIVGHMPPGWRMLEESQAHTAETANKIVWQLDVPAGGDANLTYKMRVTR